MRGKRLNKRILVYCLEILIVAIMLLISYDGFVNSSILSYAQVAENSENYNQDLKILYGKNSSDDVTILSSENLLDVGVLSIENPNNHVVTSLLTLKIAANTILDLSLIEIQINDKFISKDRFELLDGYYSTTIEKREVEAKNTIYYRIKFHGDALYVNTNDFSYHFEVLESFYS